MARWVIQNAAGLSEFVGLPVHEFGDCGEDATLMALHCVFPAKYPLSGVGLGSLDSIEQSEGYADPGGAQTITSLHDYLASQHIDHHFWGFGTPDIVDILHRQLRNFLTQHSNDPIIVEYAAAGAGFPDDERAVQYHFNVFLGEDDSAPAPEGFIGGYLRGDGDSRTDSPAGATTPLILTPWAEIERAVPIGIVQVHMTQTNVGRIDRSVHGPTVVE